MIKWLVRVGAVIGVLLILFVATMLLLGGGREAAVYEQKTIFSRPAASVFPWIVEPSRLPQWLGGLVETVPEQPGGPRVGSRAREIMNVDGQRWEMRSEITAYDPPRRIALHLTADGFSVDSDYVLDESVHEGVAMTTMTYRSTARYEHLLTRLLSPLMRDSVERKLRADFAMLKGLVEREPAMAPRAVPSGPAFKGCCAEPPPGQ